MAKLIPLFADLNVSPLTVEALVREGWDVVRISSRIPARSPDREILDLARREGRGIVTQDLDFSALLALGGFDRPSLVTPPAVGHGSGDRHPAPPRDRTAPGAGSPGRVRRHDRRQGSQGTETANPMNREGERPCAA